MHMLGVIYGGNAGFGAQFPNQWKRRPLHGRVTMHSGGVLSFGARLQADHRVLELYLHQQCGAIHT